MENGYVGVADVSVAEAAHKHVVDGTKEELFQRFVSFVILLVESASVVKLETDVGDDRTCAACGDGVFWARVVGWDEGYLAEVVVDIWSDGKVEET